MNRTAWQRVNALTDSATLKLRPESDADETFLEALYGTTRADEMALVQWPEAQVRQFVGQQFRAQRAHYRRHYPGAAFLVVEKDGQPIGRLYLHTTGRELRLMDILLLPEWRGHGLGRQLLAAVVRMAMDASLPVTLHVEPFNPARRWYQRLGFELLDERGVYWFMRLPAERLAPARQLLVC
ncbi:GNAT family N-acetyltransferase [Wenzhouxiangella sp. AB-CW3]|uniref:GNAT family N-acetyltransferase n=1 Tax=Wenzhouxiangella sp. AB-CW3 TaxID=2771012 RepID=UPI00168B9256|nr:GNAT family N-acetyltransferase [Wenzhouxiangella sp. AB-CW3]QOC22937.1 GNAT family N-acetyltransferase [Wenzhouxiangella sp. AB-CW3]